MNFQRRFFFLDKKAYFIILVCSIIWLLNMKNRQKTKLIEKESRKNKKKGEPQD